MHARKQIRRCLRSLLLGDPQAEPGNPTYPLAKIGARIYTNRPIPFFQRELPSLCIYSPEEDSDDRETNPPTLFRDCDHILEVLFKASENMDDEGDDYAEAIENLLGGNQYLKDPVTGDETCARHMLVRTELGLVADESNSVYASLKLTWRTHYQTQHGFTPPSSTGKFDTMDVQMEFGAGHAGAESKDLVQNIHQGE